MKLLSGRPPAFVRLNHDYAILGLHGSIHYTNIVLAVFAVGSAVVAIFALVAAQSSANAARKLVDSSNASALAAQQSASAADKMVQSSQQAAIAAQESAGATQEYARIANEQLEETRIARRPKIEVSHNGSSKTGNEPTFHQIRVRNVGTVEVFIVETSIEANGDRLFTPIEVFSRSHSGEARIEEWPRPLRPGEEAQRVLDEEVIRRHLEFTHSFGFISRLITRGATFDPAANYQVRVRLRIGNGEEFHSREFSVSVRQIKSSASKPSEIQPPPQ
jgi:hypothetical protein